MSDNWQQEAEERKARLVEFIGTLGLNYHADLVPMSKSRNAVDKPQKLSDLTINWRITISKGRGKLTTDYQQGIGYLPKSAKYDLKYADDFQLAVKTCETGKLYRETHYPLVTGTVAPPELIDVLYSLVLDTYAIEYATFEDWAQEFGYGIDSRKAEVVYNACIKISLQLRQLISDDSLRLLRELYQDY